MMARGPRPSPATPSLCALRGTWATGPARPSPTSLGDARLLTGDYPGAARDLEEALGISRDLGDRFGQADALTNLGRVRMTSDYPGATRDLEEALGIYRDLGTGQGQARALNNLGLCGG